MQKLRDNLMQSCTPTDDFNAMLKQLDAVLVKLETTENAREEYFQNFKNSCELILGGESTETIRLAVARGVCGLVLDCGTKELQRSVGQAVQTLYGAVVDAVTQNHIQQSRLQTSSTFQANQEHTSFSQTPVIPQRSEEHTRYHAVGKVEKQASSSEVSIQTAPGQTTTKLQRSTSDEDVPNNRPAMLRISAMLN
jgi:tetrahydromethanopterin S-methyltransferase subunit G